MNGVHYFLKQNGILRHTLTPAPTMMQSNFSLESVSETTLSSVPVGSRRQLCNSYTSSTNLLFASCAAARTRLASHPVAVDKLGSINLESTPIRRTFFLAIFSSFLF